jgi:hypothetical protein
MTALPIDFRCLVGKYELREVRPAPGEDAPWPDIVRVGDTRLVTPRREAMDKAVQLLLKIQMPKWDAVELKRLADRTASPKRRAEILADLTGILKQIHPAEPCVDPKEFSQMGRAALAIAQQTGLLHVSHRRIEEYDKWRSDPTQPRWGIDGPDRESVQYWYGLSQTIKALFHGPRGHIFSGRGYGGIEIYLSAGSGVTEVRLRPSSTMAMLTYHAAQMIAAGTTIQTCTQCGSSFLGGGSGAGRRGPKKRADARFCSDRCRWTYHNEQNRKSKS